MKNAALVRPTANLEIARMQARVIDIRTRRPWRAPDAPVWPFLLDMAITLAVMLLGAWLFQKMRGGCSPPARPPPLDSGGLKSDSREPSGPLAGERA